MNTLIPGAPLRSLSPTSNEYQRAEGVSRAAKPARVARFILDAPEHSGTIPGARGDILTPGVALTSNLAVIFTLNQHTREPVMGNFFSSETRVNGTSMFEKFIPMRDISIRSVLTSRSATSCSKASACAAYCW